MTTSDFIKTTESASFKDGELSAAMLEWLDNLRRWRNGGTHWCTAYGAASARTLDALYQRGLVDKHITMTSSRIGDTRHVYVDAETWRINEHGTEAITAALEAGAATTKSEEG